MIHSAKFASEHDSEDEIMEANSARTAYRNYWISENLDRINLTMPKGKKEQVRKFANMLGISVNAFINKAIDEKIEEVVKSSTNSHR